MLKPGNKIQFIRETKVFGQEGRSERLITYSIVYKPVFFTYSGNWSIRATTGDFNDVIEGRQLTEYIYVSDHNRHKLFVDEDLIKEYAVSSLVKTKLRVVDDEPKPKLIVRD